MSKEGISRGDFLKIAGAAGVAAGAAALGNKESLAAGGPGNEEKGEVLTEARLSIEGVPEKVNPEHVLSAEKPEVRDQGFENTIGEGTGIMFAEPGTLLVNTGEWALMAMENGKHKEYLETLSQRSVEAYSPANQIPLTNCDKEGNPTAHSVSLDEGAFLFAKASKLSMEVGDFKINVDGPERNNWFVVLRGNFPDNKQDSDLNRTALITDYQPGHALVERYPPGAFISEGQFKQYAEASHTGQGGTVGKEGGSELNVLVLDVNTGAYNHLRHTHKQGEEPGSWEKIASNIKE